MRARHQQRDDRGSCGTAGLLHVAVVLAMSALSACAYSKKLEKPIPLEQKGAVASAADERVTASIDAVIVRDGPGSWSRNADWDEYLIHVRATSGWPVDVTEVVVTDSLGKGHKPSPYRTQLARESKKTARRYDDEDLEVTAGTGGALFAGGVAVGGTSAAVGLATLGSSGAAVGAATAGALVVAPVLLAAGVVVGIQGRQVELEIYRRATEFPVTVAAGADVALDLFIPLAPAPQQVEIKYTDPAGGHVLVIDTRAALAGLHLLPKDGAPSVAAPSPTETR